MWRGDSMEDSEAGKIEGKRKGRQRTRCCWMGITDCMDTNLEQTPGRWWTVHKPGTLQSKVAKWNTAWQLNNNHQITSLFKFHTFYYISKVPFDMYGNIFTDFGENIDTSGGYYAYQIISLVFCGLEPFDTRISCSLLSCKNMLIFFSSSV